VIQSGHDGTPIEVATNSRHLLAGLRDIMAGSGNAKEKLGKIVQVIASEMVAEVCSCYVRRAGDILELFATIGLHQSAIHQTKLRLGEGVVGDVAAHARPLALSDARHHPSFSYRPETGEDPFDSMLAAPVLRDGKVRGVLVIQNRDRRVYTDVEVEILQTTAMVIAELLANGELVNATEIIVGSQDALMPVRRAAVILNGGLSIGIAVRHDPQITLLKMVADDPIIEEERLQTALTAMIGQIDDLLHHHAGRTAHHREALDVLESYRMFASDHGWMRRIVEAIRTGLTAEAAVQRVQNDMRARLSQVTDPVFREKLSDLDDLAHRLLRQLAGNQGHAILPDNAILLARSLGPAELLDYDTTRLAGVIVEEATPSSHVAIVAKALGIPALGQCPGLIEQVEPLDTLIVDGDHGQVLVRPMEEVQEQFRHSIRLRDLRQRVFRENAALPAITLDNVSIRVMMNAGLLIDLPHLHSSGADGIGLYRTEVTFMIRDNYPDVAAQEQLYTQIFNRVEGKPVVFRTLDVGGDKMLPYFTAGNEENPALGWRAVRIGLDRPAMLCRQLRALIRAGSGQVLRVMFPFVATAAEWRAANQLLNRELARQQARQLPMPIRVERGVMLEIPSLLEELPDLMDDLDFISIGSNDLLQYFYAADRTNPRLTGRYDTLSPSFLRLLQRILKMAADYYKPVSLCGEMASRPLEALALLGLGFRTLSVSPSSLDIVKTMIRSVDSARLYDFIADRLARSCQNIRGELYAYARDHAIVVGYSQ